MSEKIGEGMDPSRMKKYHEGWIQHQADGKKVCPFLHFLLLDFVQAMYVMEYSTWLYLMKDMFCSCLQSIFAFDL